MAKVRIDRTDLPVLARKVVGGKVVEIYQYQIDQRESAVRCDVIVYKLKNPDATPDIERVFNKQYVLGGSIALGAEASEVSYDELPPYIRPIFDGKSTTRWRISWSNTLRERCPQFFRKKGD